MCSIRASTQKNAAFLDGNSLPRISQRNAVKLSVSCCDRLYLNVVYEIRTLGESKKGGERGRLTDKVKVKLSLWHP